ncbi:MAG: UdgX family uracil-DNA binding protein [Nocardioides sp.]|nr:UdgX family uracil-DNA binding protein [Nocardioides sp.]
MPQKKPDRPGAEAWLPQHLDPEALAAGIEACRGCELYRAATHGVPGEGRYDADLMLVGEQPGDQEDRQARPFVGPAGRLLARALEEAGLDPDGVYRTNAVKHFRFDPGRAGKRIHKGPSRAHIGACGPWLAAEIELVQPKGVVLLGATAGSAVFGSSFRVGASRGRELEWPEEYHTEWQPEWALATTHPSAILRSRNRDKDLAALVEDLAEARQLLAR